MAQIVLLGWEYLPWTLNFSKTSTYVLTVNVWEIPTIHRLDWFLVVEGLSVKAREQWHPQLPLAGLTTDCWNYSCRQPRSQFWFRVFLSLQRPVLAISLYFYWLLHSCPLSNSSKSWSRVASNLCQSWNPQNRRVLDKIFQTPWLCVSNAQI